MTPSLRGLLAVAVSSSLVLAQSDKPPAPASGAGWSAKPGSGIKFDGGDTFGLELRNRLQVHWTYANNEDAADRNNFAVRRARTTLTGHVFQKNLVYYLMFDAIDQGAAGGALKQGWAQWNFASSESSTVGLRAGQAKTMFGLEATATSGGLWFVERSSASRAFADAFSRGAWLNGLMAGKQLRWAAGAMNTDVANGLNATNYTDVGEETNNSDNELSYVLSANFDPMGDFFGGRQTAESFRQGDWRTDDRSLKGTIGAALAIGNGKDTASGNDIESQSINVNTAWNVAGFNVLAEYFMRTDDLQGPVADEEEPTGMAIGAGYLLDRSGDSAIQWGLGVRFSTIAFDEGAAGSGVDYLQGGNVLTSTTATGNGAVESDVTEISAIVNAFYHGHPCKTQFEYTMQDVDPSGAAAGRTNHLFRIAFQIEF